MEQLPDLHVSLQGSSDQAIICGTQVTPDGWKSKLFTIGCPHGTVRHWRVDLSKNYGGGSFWIYSAFSIQRTTDGHIGPMTQSPAIHT